jgi:hypothetical protein
MATASTALAGIKPILGSSVETYTLFPPEGKAPQNVDRQIVYISQILKNGTEVIVRPLSFGNKESLINAKDIVQKKLLITIELKAEGIFLSLYSAKNDELSDNSIKLSVEYQDKLHSLGEVRGTNVYDENGYKALPAVYAKFLTIAKETLARAKGAAANH